MPNYSAKVVKYFREKSQNGFDLPISWLGAEQRFVGAIRNSNLNNLEEQYTLGTDTYTIYSTDQDDNQIIERHYCKTPNGGLQGVTDYYKVITTIYNTPVPSKDFEFVNTALNIDTSVPFVFGDGSVDYPHTYGAYGLNENAFVFSGDKIILYPKSFNILQKDELWFVSSVSASDVLVATKYIGEKYTIDGDRIVQERIVNELPN